MGNIFTSIKNTIAKPVSTGVTFNVGKFFGRIGSSIKPISSVKKPMSYLPNLNKSINILNKADSLKSTINYNQFIKGIALQESGKAGYNAIGKTLIRGMHAGSKALGKYQFMPKTLERLGYNQPFSNFIKDPKIQEKYMLELTKRNARDLGIKDINKLNATQARALSIAHYSGSPKAKKWLMSGMSRDMLKPQTTTVNKAPSIANYSSSVMNKIYNNIK